MYTFDLDVFCRSHFIQMSFVLVSFDTEDSVDTFVQRMDADAEPAAESDEDLAAEDP